MINFLFQASTLPVSKHLIGGLLLSASTFLGAPEAPTRPMSFDASVFVTQQGKIRLSLEKMTPARVSVQVLDQNSAVLYSQSIGKKMRKTALLFDVSDLGDGTYTLEIKSDEGVIRRQVIVNTPRANRVVTVG